MKKGLVMEGGAMRGMFTAGITDVMMEHKIEFDGAIGVSAGAAFGCNFKSKQPGRAIRYNVAYCNNSNYAGIESLVKTGNIFGEQFCYHDIPDRLDPFDYETYLKNPMEFYVVATDVRTGNAVYHRVDKCDDNGMKWIRASASMPLVSKIVNVDGYELLDGGVADSIPLDYMQKKGYDRNVVILTQPSGFVKKKNNLIPLAKIMLRDYPEMIHAMEIRHEIYNDTLAFVRECEKNGSIFVIRPPKTLGVARVERSRSKLLAAYQQGRETMEKNLEAMCSFLKG